MITNFFFNAADLNGDGVIDMEEIKIMRDINSNHFSDILKAKVSFIG